MSRSVKLTVQLATPLLDFRKGFKGQFAGSTERDDWLRIVTAEFNSRIDKR